MNEYMLDMNATNAAVRAGYSPKTARQLGSKLLTNIDIKAEIVRKQRESELKLDIDREMVLNGLVSAIGISKNDNDPMAMILAAAEINKMMGYYN